MHLDATPELAGSEEPAVRSALEHVDVERSMLAQGEVGAWRRAGLVESAAAELDQVSAALVRPRAAGLLVELPQALSPRRTRGATRA